MMRLKLFITSKRKETNDMNKLKMLSVFLLLALLGMAQHVYSQAVHDLQVPMSQQSVYGGQYVPVYNGMQSTSAYQGTVSGHEAASQGIFNRSVSEAEIQNMYHTTYDNNSTNGTGRVKRRLGDDDDGDGDDDAADGKEHTEQPGNPLVIGNGFWLLVIAAMGYCIYILRRLRKEDEAAEASED